MADDPYEILGVKKSATEAEIRAAYRKLAKKHHPDLNPGNKTAEEAFKRVSGANDLLSDAEKRGRYDRGEIDGSGAERARPQRGYREYAEAPAGARYGFGGGGANNGGGGGFDGEGFEDLFSGIFGQQGARRGGPMRGGDTHYVLSAGFLEAVNGGTKRLTLPEGGVLDVRIPVGTEDGDVLRLKGKGGAGRGGGPAGDALIEIRVMEHGFFRREGADIFVTLPVSLREAVLGGKISAPTPGGVVALTVAAGSDTGTRLRLRGRGVPAHGGVAAGDLYVTLEVRLGAVDEGVREALAKREVADWNPREGMVP